jgi:hypothetical protein
MFSVANAYCSIRRGSENKLKSNSEESNSSISLKKEGCVYYLLLFLLNLFCQALFPDISKFTLIAFSGIDVSKCTSTTAV